MLGKRFALTLGGTSLHPFLAGKGRKGKAGLLSDWDGF